uniref:subunit 4 of NADH-plastoquinone oxidoreductase n=1 Tax=Streptosarcina arenaria TaxID=2058782 RepID=UPI00286D3041|nr:subunit 4 of NADH-plastoquinone oxidoreductase [Streptosarcina arenaria]WKT08815.1 subunit 4 of NADH-plastoquinone oxidoreductase [Streptosarcina arenaria]
MNEFPLLTSIVLFPLSAALAIPFLSDRGNQNVRWYSLGVCLLDLVLILYAFGHCYDPQDSALQLQERYEWIPALHFRWSLGADGLSMCLVLLTGFVTTLATLAAWPITRHPKLFHVLMLAMYTGQVGIFVSQDMLLFFLMWELELIPVYLLLTLWGGKKRLYAATKFIVYTALASIFILVAALAMAFYGEPVTWDLQALAMKDYPLGLEILIYLGLWIAFGVKIAAFPLHTWLPEAHGEAHSSTCMLLAGILLKMGGYGMIRINMQLLPHAHAYLAPWLVVVGVINVVYAALTSLAQRNLKRKIAYSSVSHMGFVLIGVGSLTDAGLDGAILQMVSHGLIGAALFFLAGSTYDRTRTIMLEDMGGLTTPMPKMFAIFTAGSLASLALPGMSGFVSELMVFLGLVTSETYSVGFRVIATVCGAVGVILTPIYLLAMLRQVFYGMPSKSKIAVQQLIDAGPREVFILSCLLVPTIGIGFYPKLVTQLYHYSSYTTFAGVS